MYYDFHAHFNSRDPEEVKIFVKNCEKNQTCAVMSGGSNNKISANWEEIIKYCREYPEWILPGAKIDLWDTTPDLANIRKIKDMGYLVKLDTNGSNPRMLRQLLEEKLLDYVAMDIKNCPDRYAVTCGGVDILPQVEECLSLLRDGTVEYELRTTLCKPFHDENAMEAMGKWLSGTKNYYLQAFVDSGDLVGAGVSGFTKEEMEALRKYVLPYIPNTRIRGI
jgi:hypothetical protein